MVKMLLFNLVYHMITYSVVHFLIRYHLLIINFIGIINMTGFF